MPVRRSPCRTRARSPTAVARAAATNGRPAPAARTGRTPGPTAGSACAASSAHGQLPGPKRHPEPDSSRREELAPPAPSASTSRGRPDGVERAPRVQHGPAHAQVLLPRLDPLGPVRGDAVRWIGQRTEQPAAPELVGRFDADGMGSRRTSASPICQLWGCPSGDRPNRITSHPAAAAERAAFWTRESPRTVLSTSMTTRPRIRRGSSAAGDAGGSAFLRAFVARDRGGGTACWVSTSTPTHGSVAPDVGAACRY